MEAQRCLGAMASARPVPESWEGGYCGWSSEVAHEYRGIAMPRPAWKVRDGDDTNFTVMYGEGVDGRTNGGCRICVLVSIWEVCMVIGMVGQLIVHLRHLTSAAPVGIVWV